MGNREEHAANQMNNQVSKMKGTFQRKSMRNVSRTKVKERKNVPVRERGAPGPRPGDRRFKGEVGVIELAGGSQAYEGTQTEHPQYL